MVRILAGLLVMVVVAGRSSPANRAMHPAAAPAWLDTGTPSSFIAPHNA